MWRKPNIVFYIEMDYLSIDESKLLNSNEDKTKTRGVVPMETNAYAMRVHFIAHWPLTNTLYLVLKNPILWASLKTSTM